VLYIRLGINKMVSYEDIVAYDVGPAAVRNTGLDS
jgi:hypothetical protein